MSPTWRFMRPYLSLGALLLLIGLTLSGHAYAGLFRDSWSSEEDILLISGETLHVKESGSQKRWFGLGHGLGFGGGDPKSKLEFKHSGRVIAWEGAFIPISLQFDNGVPVLIVFDRETDWAKSRFRYYRHANGWIERPITDFPRVLANQNLWLSHKAGRDDAGEIDEYIVVKECDPASPRFRASLMAKLWIAIETGKNLMEIEQIEITREMLQRFKDSQREQKR